MIRYDTAHGVPYLDTLDWNGSVVHKKWFYGKPPDKAVTDAIADVKSHRKSYGEEFERRKP